MTRLKTMTTQFIDGDPNGVRILQRILSPMTAIVVPRQMLSRAKELIDIPKQGIYYLINDEEGTISSLYVGQTTQGISRLDAHNVNKDFWNKAILFLADSKTFTLDIISALEKFAIEEAMDSKRYEVENKVDPKFRIDQYQQPIVEEIYEEIAFVMATLGYDMEAVDNTTSNIKIFSTSRRGIVARGFYSGDKFNVLEGSILDLKVKSGIDRHEKIREELIDNGDIEVLKDGTGKLKKTVSFGSPSGASVFVLGGNTNGWVEWKDVNGKTLGELYR